LPLAMNKYCMFLGGSESTMLKETLAPLDCRARH
jgi:hypothetical protein